ncbi:MAG: multicopper oxidase domain-containing protein, partial [Bryobacteraceae bacterium]
MSHFAHARLYNREVYNPEHAKRRLLSHTLTFLGRTPRRLSDNYLPISSRTWGNPLPVPIFSRADSDILESSVPGPTMEAKEGDRVRVIFENHLPEMTSVHWHGFEVPVEMDGSV